MLGKVYAKIVDNNVEQKTEGKMLEVQGGFVDQILTVRQLTEKLPEKGKQMAVVCVYIDLERAYDTVRRDQLWQAVRGV